MKEKLISDEMIRKVHPVFRGRFGNILTKLVLKLSGLNKVNAVYDGSKQYTGVEFTTDLLDKLEITRNVENIEVLKQFEGKPFITVSNHPYGHIDGIMVADLVGRQRSDFKIMVNWVLMQIDTMEEFFIGVNPFPGDGKLANAKSSVGGVKESISHLKGGHPLGFFPAGGISLPNITGDVVDNVWQSSVIRIIKKARVPVIPIYISGKNSFWFQLLGHISWKVRTARLLHEVTSKRGKTITIRFGEPIWPEDQDKYSDMNEFGEYLKSKTYELNIKKGKS